MLTFAALQFFCHTLGMRRAFFLTFYFVVLLRAFRALLGALRALLRESAPCLS